MKKFFDWMEEHFVPIAAKIGAQRHLVAIRDGFATITPLIMAGAFASLFNNLGFKPYQNFMDWLLPVGWKAWGGAIWNGSFGVMSILIVFTISYHLANGYGKDGMSAGIVSLSAAMILYAANAEGALPFDFLGAQGLFISLIVALVATELFVKLIGNPKLVIKMPEGVPPAVSKSFAALMPSIIILAITAGIKELFIVINIPDVHKALFLALQQPLQGVAGSLGGVLLIIFVSQLLWFFGLHGSNILLPIINALLLPLLVANTDRLNAGLEPEHILNSQFLDSYVNMGGSGTTIALIIAIYILRKKAGAQQRMIANLGVAPGCFNINEPVIFGMPIVLNPMYFIPFMLAPIVSALTAYGLTAIHFVPKVSIMATWTTPPIVGAILSTNSIMGGVTALICLALSVLIYLPFVYVAGKQELKND
ncbi:PTS sugar transporter subunit IIC [Clostridium botulinum]|uniref:PTS sugar transporter subunit IIC n=1 Tax=Clostridium sp. ZS1 TaxID=2949989 RepID=UPI0013C84A52|nr:PTS sugar transporter subunit IIC [Clostridium sp. ZS1]MBN1038397.1 PTS sugar transporter subunit IIC [Clostridium botulinum]MBN1045147.1 PTS sugar transporter subunit IIC [Clostridium botulinum]MBN1067726.1 PTS sugar transporter subunit IIC [Clostridium botulinum]NFI95146.1 PTS sugar transporter subunit IIC [Clostridium botulinum]NFO92392.1 PTS sugar transporter subunit IIC [Clostridium botulinum]